MRRSRRSCRPGDDVRLGALEEEAEAKPRAGVIDGEGAREAFLELARDTGCDLEGGRYAIARALADGTGDGPREEVGDGHGMRRPNAMVKCC